LGWADSETADGTLIKIADVAPHAEGHRPHLMLLELRSAVVQLPRFLLRCHFLHAGGAAHTRPSSVRCLHKRLARRASLLGQFGRRHDKASDELGSAEILAFDDIDYAEPNTVNVRELVSDQPVGLARLEAADVFTTGEVEAEDAHTPEYATGSAAGCIVASSGMSRRGPCVTRRMAEAGKLVSLSWLLPRG